MADPATNSPQAYLREVRRARARLASNPAALGQRLRQLNRARDLEAPARPLPRQHPDVAPRVRSACPSPVSAPRPTVDHVSVRRVTATDPCPVVDAAIVSRAEASTPAALPSPSAGSGTAARSPAPSSRSGGSARSGSAASGSGTSAASTSPSSRPGTSARSSSPAPRATGAATSDGGRVGVLGVSADVGDAFATEVEAAIEGGLLRHTARRRLLARADRLGIGRFDANLLIASVLHHHPGPSGPSSPDARRAGIAGWIAAVLVVEALVVVAWLVAG